MARPVNRQLIALGVKSSLAQHITDMLQQELMVGYTSGVRLHRPNDHDRVCRHFFNPRRPITSTSECESQLKSDRSFARQRVEIRPVNVFEIIIAEIQLGVGGSHLNLW